MKCKVYFFNEKYSNWNFRFGGDLSYSCKKLPNIFFFSILLLFGTFVVIMLLRGFKLIPHMPYKVARCKIVICILNQIIVSLVSDYSVIISIIVFTLVDSQCGLETSKLQPPTEFKVNYACYVFTFL